MPRDDLLKTLLIFITKNVICQFVIFTTIDCQFMCYFSEVTKYNLSNMTS